MFSSTDPSSRISTSSSRMAFLNRLMAGVTNPIRRKTHELVFAAVDPEAAVIGESGIEQSKEWGKVSSRRISTHCRAAARSSSWPIPPRRQWSVWPLPQTERDKMRWLHEKDGVREKAAAVCGRRADREGFQFIPQHLAHEQLFLDPDRHGRKEALQSGGANA